MTLEEKAMAVKEACFSRIGRGRSGTMARRWVPARLVVELCRGKGKSKTNSKTNSKGKGKGKGACTCSG